MKCKWCGAEYDHLPSKEEIRLWCPNHSIREGNSLFNRKCYGWIWPDGSQTFEYPNE